MDLLFNASAPISHVLLAPGEVQLDVLEIAGIKATPLADGTESGGNPIARLQFSCRHARFYINSCFSLSKYFN
jgi:hypothetical protein